MTNRSDRSITAHATAPPPRSAFARWRELSGHDKRRLLALMWLLPLVHLALALFPLLRVRGFLERSSANRVPVDCTPEAIADAERLAELAEIAGRRGAVAASCLRQALVVWWWLRRRGLSAQLRIGVTGGGEAFAAHAWVELGGVALAQKDLPHQAFEGL
jgi:hypothetical protein